MSSLAIADRTIEQVPRKEIIHHHWGDTSDIIRVVMAVVNKDYLQRQVEVFAKSFRGNTADEQYEGLRRLWAFCRNNIYYEPDPPGVQDILHPARLWDKRTGDCKSLTVFIYFVCRANGIPCYIRFASYASDGQIGHVYPVAIVGGEAVPVDAVYKHFDREAKATKIKDKFPVVWDTQPVRKVAAAHRKEPKYHGGIFGFMYGGFKFPTWVGYAYAGLSIVQVFRSDDLLTQFVWGLSGATTLAALLEGKESSETEGSLQQPQNTFLQ